MIATDMKADAMKRAEENGAITVPGGDDQVEAIREYRSGQIRPDIERFAMDDALDAYRRLQSGELSGRAVVTPHS